LCLQCDRWQERRHFATPPSRRGLPWPYCRECVRVIDRQRARSIRGTPEWTADMERRARQKRAQRTQEHAERREFVRVGILMLRRRGLTKSEVARVCDLSLSNLLRWERGQVVPDPNVARRVGELLLLTADWTLASEPTFRRRLPHPALPELAAGMCAVVERYPVRSRWRDI
jgi:DNA-binding transcriptional regulator YiaG